tara:strand:- start:548 stop:907 length:360 start_codon:yes stop_codon:yes gene_type:complete
MSDWTMRNYTYTYALVSYKVEETEEKTDVVSEVNVNITATDTSSNSVTFPWSLTFCKFTTSGTCLLSGKTINYTPLADLTDAKIVAWFKSAMAYDDRDKMLNHYAAQLLEGRTSDNPAP